LKNHFLLGVSVAALGLTSPAIAAPPPPPIYSWTGFYAGVNAGYSWGNADSNLNDLGLAGGFGNGIGFTNSLPGSFPVSLRPEGFIGGAQAGYNWQVSPGWLIGLEADLQGSAEKDRVSRVFSYGCDVEGLTTCNLSQTRDAKIDWFGTVRGRIGWLPTQTSLLYVTGGLAYGRVSVTGTVTDDTNNTGASFTFGDSRLKAGFALGAGFEAAFAPKWTVKMEYLYVDLGSIGGSGIEPISGSVYSWDAKFVDHILRAGVNYKLP
jgi:outer membrane immunogenic protein